MSHQDSSKGFASKEDVYTKEELMKFFRKDSEDYSHAMYYKLTLTLMHKMLGEEDKVYKLNDEEVEQLKNCEKTEALDMLLRIAENTTFSFKNGMIKQIERVMIDSDNEHYRFIKENYLEHMLYYFIRDDKESYNERAAHTGLNIEDIVKNLQSKKLPIVLKEIFDNSKSLNKEKTEELLAKLTFDEQTKQTYLYTTIKDILDYKGNFKIIESIFNFVEDKEKLFKATKALINSDEPKKAKEKISYLESAYLESKISENGFDKEDEISIKKRI